MSETDWGAFQRWWIDTYCQDGAYRKMDDVAWAAWQAGASASSSPAPAAGPAPKQWPFVESPGAFTKRLRDALFDLDQDLLAAVRNVLIENPPQLATISPLPAAADAGLAHELWSAAQLAPGEGVEDGVRRIAALLPAAAGVEDRAGLVESCFNLTDSLEWTTRHSCEGNASADDVAEVRDALRDAIDRLASSAAQVPEGMALVPLRMNSEMQRVSREDGWQWEDLLAAAGCTEEQCIAASEEPMQAEDVPNSPCAACDGDGRVPSPEECTRCGLRGCWTVECAACGGTGEVAAAPAAGGV